MGAADADDEITEIAAKAETTYNEMRILLPEVRAALRISVAFREL
jgi:hypothetical protein